MCENWSRISSQFLSLSLSLSNFKNGKSSFPMLFSIVFRLPLSTTTFMNEEMIKRSSLKNSRNMYISSTINYFNDVLSFVVMLLRMIFSYSQTQL